MGSPLTVVSTANHAYQQIVVVFSAVGIYFINILGTLGKAALNEYIK